MSQHPSLRIDNVGVKHRNVLKRFERIKKLQEQEKWQNGNSVFGLPKVKSVKVKVKKTKEAPAEEAKSTVAGAVPQPSAPPQAAKPQAAGTAKADKGKK